MTVHNPTPDPGEASGEREERQRRSMPPRRPPRCQAEGKSPLSPKLITVPAELVQQLHQGAYHELGFAADDIGQATERVEHERHPEWFQAPLERLDDARALLDAIGWKHLTPPAAIRIDIREHPTAIIDALQTEQGVEKDALQNAETERNEPQRLAIAQRVRTLSEFIASLQAEAGALHRQEQTE